MLEVAPDKVPRVRYARLMAVGAAGVVLAGIANDVGRMGEGQSIFWIAVFVGLAIFLHMCAFVLIIFDPLVQGLRLHYVEFFTKFFEGGGKPFIPFGIDNGGE